MAYVRVDVDIDDFDDDDLIEELESRGYTVEETDDEKDEDDVPETSRTRMPSSYTINRFFDRHKLRTHLENITGCGGYVSNEELLEQLKYLLENG
jgi:hypothetical protein